MTELEIKEKLTHYLSLYAIDQDEQYLIGIITYSSMLVGKS